VYVMTLRQSSENSDDTGLPAARFDDFYAAHFQRLSIQLYAYTGDVAQAQDVRRGAWRAHHRHVRLPPGAVSTGADRHRPRRLHAQHRGRSQG
jgi:hypothetical protein